MTSLVPATNIQAAIVAGVIVTAAQHIFAAYGYTLTPDVASSLSAFVTVLVAHAWDVLTAIPDPAAAAPKV